MDARTTKHALQLELQLKSAQQVIDDLVRENYELKGLLQHASRTKPERPQGSARPQ